MANRPVPTPENSDPRTPAAERALAEAAARRVEADTRRASALPPAREIGGRGGPDPVRFDDWEIGGRAVDF